MKRLNLLLILLFAAMVSSQAHEKITFLNKESFHTTCNEGSFCSSFNLGLIEDKAAIKQANQFVKENSNLIKAEMGKDGFVQLTLSATVDQKLIYQKLFMQLGLTEIEILEGDNKGTYSVEEFLNLYF